VLHLGALGIAILGSIGTAVYRRELADTVPTGVPPQIADAARETLGGALAVSERLPDRAGDHCWSRLGRNRGAAGDR
jgi:DHA2 family multidrug resistance protein-like MFS transporter